MTLEGWLPLSGRWLRYAGVGLLGAPMLGLAVVALMVGRCGVLLLPVGLFFMRPLRSHVASAPALPFAVVGVWLLALWLGPYLVDQAMSAGLRSGFSCGTCRSAFLDYLFGFQPLVLCVGMGGCWVVRGSYVEGILARIPVLTCLVLWAWSAFFTLNPSFLR